MADRDASLIARLRSFRQNPALPDAESSLRVVLDRRAQELEYSRAKRILIVVLVLLAGVAAIAAGVVYDRKARSDAAPGSIRAAADVGPPQDYRDLLAREPIPAVAPVVIPDMPRETAREINRAVPFVTGANPPATPFRSRLTEGDRMRAVDCLSAAMWYEAGADAEGQQAVAQVVLNRVRHPAFPHSVCGVVFQGSERATGCQFTFTCDGAMARIPSAAAWTQSHARAERALDGAVFRPVGLATHYHADWVVPYWSSTLDKLVAVRTHLFFRWRGGWGRSVAFRIAPAASEPVIARLARYSAAHHAEGTIEMPALEDDTIAALGGVAVAGPGDVMLARPALPALRGGRVALVHPQGDAFAVVFDKTLRPGGYALAALDLCGTRSFCKVMGWLDEARVPRRFPIGTAASTDMAFVYLRQNGQDYTRWDCRQVRDPPGQGCMDANAAPWDRQAIPG